MKNAGFSSYPYPFALGQVGQLVQTTESLVNRLSCVFILHIYGGTALGHGGTTDFQDVAGRKKPRMCSAGTR